MSWTDEEIDNLFQESAKAQSFEYNNAYFSEVEAMLPVNKKGKDFLWMGTALLFIAVLTTGYFVNNNNENTFGGTNDQLANLELNTKNGNATESNAANVQEKSIENKEGVNVLTNEAFIENGTSNEKAAKAESFLQGGYYRMDDPQSKTKVVVNNSNASDSKGTGLARTANGSGDSDLNALIKDGTLEPLINLKADTKVKNQIDLNVNRAPVSASLGVNGANQLEQGLDRSLIENALSMPVLSELRPKAAFYVELNAGMSQSFLTSSGDAPTSYGGGIGVESYLGKFNLTTGLNFKVSDHNDLFLSREGIGKIYGFSSTPSVTNTYDFEQLYTFELPISLGYNFGKHNVNIGVRPSFSYGAKINEQEFVGEELTRSNKQSYLINQAVNRFGLKPTFGYSYHINKWTIGANIGVQLIETLDEGYFDGTIKQFPIDGQIYFRRTIRLRK